MNTNTEREELAEVFAGYPVGLGSDPKKLMKGHAQEIAALILSSGYRKLRVIRECYPENEVENLPAGSVVLSDGIAYVRNVNGTWVDKNDFVEDSCDLALPVFVLWEERA